MAGTLIWSWPSARPANLHSGSGTALRTCLADLRLCTGVGGGSPCPALPVLPAGIHLRGPCHASCDLRIVPRRPPATPTPTPTSTRPLPTGLCVRCAVGAVSCALATAAVCQGLRRIATAVRRPWGSCVCLPPSTTCLVWQSAMDNCTTGDEGFCMGRPPFVGDEHASPNKCRAVSTTAEPSGPSASGLCRHHDPRGWACRPTVGTGAPEPPGRRAGAPRHPRCRAIHMLRSLDGKCARSARNTRGSPHVFSQDLRSARQSDMPLPENEKAGG